MHFKGLTCNCTVLPPVERLCLHCMLCFHHDLEVWRFHYIIRYKVYLPVLTISDNKTRFCCLIYIVRVYKKFFLQCQSLHFLLKGLVVIINRLNYVHIHINVYTAYS